MDKEYNFHEFFFLTTLDNPKANKKAVCFSCIRKYTLPVAITRPDCFISNKAKLCQAHLKKCSNFEQEYGDDERKEILSRYVPEDEKKPFQQNIIKETSGFKIDDNSVTTPKTTNTNPFTTAIKQTTLTNYVSRPFSTQDNQHFENLVLFMIVSNGLPFTFIENKEIQDVFNFIASALKLPG